MTNNVLKVSKNFNDYGISYNSKFINKMLGHQTQGTMNKNCSIINSNIFALKPI